MKHLKYIMLVVILAVFVAWAIQDSKAREAKVAADKAACMQSHGKWHRHATPDGYTDVHCGEFELLDY